MEIEWRTIQFFINQEGITSEVYIDNANPAKIKCTCITFSKIARCKHVKFIRDKMEENEGVLNVVFPAEADDDEIEHSKEDLELFRKLILKYGKIELL